MKILLPVDGSEPSQSTLQWATRFFNKDTSEIYLLTVVHKSPPEVVAEEYQVEDALKLIEKAKAELTSQGFNVVSAEYMVGDPAESICRYASDKQVEQIVIGSHGRTGLGKMLFGSVSSAVFECADQPVFIHKNKASSKVMF